MIKLMEKSFFNGEEVKKALAEFILSTDRFSMGQQCEKFEEGFAKWQKRKYCVFVSSGSMANLILIQGLMNAGKLKKGAKVGFSALTWPTNVMPLIQLGLIPVPIDCELDTLNVSSSQLLSTLKEEKLEALFITNALGFCSDLNEIKKICFDNDILLLEDNCESLGSEHGGIKLGNFGIASTFSTFIGHHMSTIEGGMICTDDKNLYEHLIMCRAHGWDRNLSDDSKSKLRSENNINDFYAMYTFHELAYNGRPTEIQGFLGNQNLPYLDEIVSLREKNFKIFNEVIASTGAIQIRTSHLNVISNFSMPVVFKEVKTFEYFKDIFLKHNIEIRPVIAGNMLRQPFYTKHVKQKKLLPNTDIVHTNGFYFTNRPDLTNEDIDTITSLLKSKA